MTALGKTLVFFNLLFSLVTGGLIVMVFLTRTNWRIGMEEAVQETKAARAALKNEQEAAKQKKIDYETEKKKLQDEITRLTTEKLGREVEVANEKARVKQANDETAKASANSEAASKEIDRLQRERNQMAEQQKTLNEQLAKSTKDLAETSNRETYARLRGDALEKDLASTREDLATLRRKHEELLARMPAGRGGAEVNPPRAPSISTTGRVTGVSGNFAQISLGSDNGIEPGHILQVYRTDPPTYLGTLAISKVNAHEAVGTFEPAGSGKKITKGDTVDTKILR